jgi:hypothetical protein
MTGEDSEPIQVRDEAAGDGGEEVITKVSPWSEATRSLASRRGGGKGMKVFAVIDHGGEAKTSDSNCGTPSSSFSAALRWNPGDGGHAAGGTGPAAQCLGVGRRKPDDGQLDSARYARRPLRPHERTGSRLRGIDALTSAVIET